MSGRNYQALERVGHPHEFEVYGPSVSVSIRGFPAGFTLDALLQLLQGAYDAGKRDAMPESKQ